MVYIINISIILLCALILYLILNRKISKSVNPRTLIEEIRGEVDKIILQLNNTTERNISLIEDKIQELSDLMDKADKKISLLKRESEKYSVSKNYNSIMNQSKKTILPDQNADSDIDIKEKVLKLHREGFSASVIAGHTNLPVGEVELIISLGNSSS